MNQISYLSEEELALGSIGFPSLSKDGDPEFSQFGNESSILKSFKKN
jgi:hypothetical protein